MADQTIAMTADPTIEAQTTTTADTTTTTQASQTSDPTQSSLIPSPVTTPVSVTEGYCQIKK